MIRLMLAVALTALASGAHAVDKSAAPQGNAAAWFTTDDYPPEALATEAEGTVTMAFDIDASGKVSFCSVVVSSGSAALDEISCRLMKERGQFVPATDKKGKPVASKGTRRVTWRMPEGGRTVIPVNALPLRITLTADLDEAGAATNCVAKVVGPPGVPIPGNAADLTCQGTGFFDDSMHILDMQNKPAKGRVQINVEMKLLPPTPSK